MPTFNFDRTRQAAAAIGSNVSPSAAFRKARRRSDIAAIAGFAAVVVILISGVRYMTAGGDAQKATGARHTLIGALVGLAIISFASLIIMFVISGID